MRRLMPRRPSPAMVVACIALVVAMGGTGYAALRLPSNSVGSKQLRKKSVTSSKLRANAVTSSKVKNGSLLARDFRAGQLTPGPKGDPGQQGPPGLPGAPGPGIRWALVKGDGTATILAQSGGIVADLHAGGIYGLDFGSSVVGHPVVAMLQDEAGGGMAIRAVVCGGAAAGPDAVGCSSSINDPNHVGVRVFDNTGMLTDQPFYVVVFS